MKFTEQEYLNIEQVDRVRKPIQNGIALTIRNLVKNFESRTVLKGINLEINPGQFTAIIGRSGCGKSTLLRLIAGLERANEGTIRLDGNYLPGYSDTRIMFQEARLLPWKTVLENVALGLQQGGEKDALNVLNAVSLQDRAAEWPIKLSGGQRQRVALARALVHRPRLLLLDEPLGALDALTRIEMHQLIEALWRENQFTALLVTHDVTEAISLADRIILIEEGKVAADVAVNLPRPRNKSSDEFKEIEELLLNKLILKR